MTRRFRDNLLHHRALLVVLAALAVAYAWPMQVTGYNQNAHYALTKALASGTPAIDRAIGEVGDLASGDTARSGGHLYAVKAPGLAFVALPLYVALDALGMRTTGDPAAAIWALHLVGAALPALALVVLVFLFGERVQPGFGLAGAAVFGIGTLVLPFATLFFAHALSAALGFAAFLVLWRERAGPGRLRAVALGGALAGLAIAAEYQLWLLAALLGLYAAARSGFARRALAYAAGAAAGLLPLFAFQLWAFGSPFHTPYADYWRERGVPSRHFTTLPSLEHASAFLLDAMGMLVLTPVLLCGLAGCALLYRRGLRAEAVVLVGTTLAYGVYFSRLGAFGGLGPPRYLLAIVPFAAAGLAVALRSLPLTTAVLGAISAFQMAVMTATGPLAAYDGDWLGRLAQGDVMQTAAAVVGVTGGYTIAPFFVALAAAAIAAASSTQVMRTAAWDSWLALGALLGWAGLALGASNEFGAAPSDGYIVATVLALALLVGAVTVALRSLPGTRARLGPAELGR